MQLEAPNPQQRLRPARVLLVVALGGLIAGAAWTVTAWQANARAMAGLERERDDLKAYVAFLNTKLQAKNGTIAALETERAEVNQKLEVERKKVKRFGSQAGQLGAQLAELQAQVSRVETSVGGTGVSRASSRNSRLSSDPSKALENLFGQLDSANRRVKDTIAGLEAQADLEASIPSEWPVEGSTLTSWFGYRFGPRTGRLERHTGWDMGVAEGTPILATARGEVIEASMSDVGYGLHVIVDHGNGFKTLYGHMSKMNVQVGDRVEVGWVLGEVGSTGNSTGPHLHYEVRLNDAPVDPGPFVDRKHPPTMLRFRADAPQWSEDASVERNQR